MLCHFLFILLPLLVHFLPSGFLSSYPCAIFVWDPRNSCYYHSALVSLLPKNPLVGLPPHQVLFQVSWRRRNLRTSCPVKDTGVARANLWVPGWLCAHHTPPRQARPSGTGEEDKRACTEQRQDLERSPGHQHPTLRAPFIETAGAFLMWPWEGCVWKWRDSWLSPQFPSVSGVCEGSSLHLKL